MPHQFRLFEAFGVELEYMIVERDTLQVSASADLLLAGDSSEVVSDREYPDIDWSNELVLHVLEFKVARPVASFEGVADSFHAHIVRANEELAQHNRMLLPTGMHPFMDPRQETQLWPHEAREIYEVFDRIFDCKAHGWANLQSCHLNLPFTTEEEFLRLHDALRVLMPLLPALAASSPLREGVHSGWLDQRLKEYAGNSRKVASSTGPLIPEAVRSIAEYRERILERIYRDLAPYDPQKVISHEFANARGAIARFTRNTIELRILDTQECPRADVAILALTVAALRRLTAQAWGNHAAQTAQSEHTLRELFLRVAQHGRNALIEDPHYLALFGRSEQRLSVAELWTAILEELRGELSPFAPELHLLTTQGSLSERILTRLGTTPTHHQVVEMYRELSQCLAQNHMLHNSRHPS